MSFADLKKRSGNISDLVKKAQELAKPQNNYVDDRLWFLTQDKSKNGFAVIRFLPAVENEDSPWVRIFSHGFQGPGGNWLIENCPTTIGQQCPICAANSELWNSGSEANKDIARKRKRKVSYISNILVIKDEAKPENEGKIFLFKYGTKIHEKIMSKLQPEFKDESPIDVFDFWKGADFKLKMQHKDGFANYDKSEFCAPSALFGGDDAKLEAFWKKQYPLAPFIDAKEFKPAEELKKRLTVILGTSYDSGTNSSATEKPAAKTKKAAAKVDDEVDEAKEESAESTSTDASDYYKSLADDEN